jgi:hypothetical protein
VCCLSVLWRAKRSRWAPQKESLDKMGFLLTQLPVNGFHVWQFHQKPPANEPGCSRALETDDQKCVRFDVLRCSRHGLDQTTETSSPKPISRHFSAFSSPSPTPTSKVTLIHAGKMGLGPAPRALQRLHTFLQSLPSALSGAFAFALMHQPIQWSRLNQGGHWRRLCSVCLV